jgi:PAS domain S-box-containing protein
MDDVIRRAPLASVLTPVAGRDRARAGLPGPNLHERLAQAVAAQRLSLEYQPVVDLPGGSVRGFEALARWHDPVLGTVPPDQFIPAAERSGLIVALGRWVVRTACRAASDWVGRPDAAPPTVAVNVSPLQLADDSFVADVKHALHGSGLSPDRLCLEITETAAIRDLVDTGRRLSELTALGVRLALDDFGTGYASLTMLRSLPFDVVKIDRSFIADVAANASDAVLVRLIIDAAHALGRKVCAEGIETPGQARQVIAVGADMAQGWLYGKPEPDSPQLRRAVLAPAHDAVLGSGRAAELALGSSDELVVIMTPGLVITYASSNSTDIVGHPPSELIGTHLSDYVQLDPAHAAECAIDANGVVEEREVITQVRHGDGTHRWLATRSQLLFNDDGTIREVLSVSRDVTETVRARIALRDSELQFTHVFDGALFGMALSTPDGRLIRVNRAFADLLGYVPDQLLEHTVADITPPEYRDPDSVNTARLIDGEVPHVDVTKMYLHAQGHHVPVQVRAILIRTGDDPPRILAHILPTATEA